MERPLTRTQCIELLREGGYTGSVSVSVPRLRELVVELGLVRRPELDEQALAAFKIVADKEAKAKSSDAKYVQSSSTSSDPTLSSWSSSRRDPSFDCGHVMRGGLASAVGELAMCFACKTNRKVVAS